MELLEGGILQAKDETGFGAELAGAIGDGVFQAFSDLIAALPQCAGQNENGI